MRATVNTKEFKALCNYAKQTTPNNPERALYHPVRMSFEDDCGWLDSSNIVSTLRTWTAATVEQPGVIYVDIHKLSDVIKNIKEETVTLHDEDDILTVASGRWEACVKLLDGHIWDATEDAHLPDSDASTVSVTRGDLLDALKLTGIITSKEEYPLYISSTIFETQGHTLNVVTTDNRRIVETTLTTTHMDTDAPAGEIFPCMIPTKQVKLLSKLLKNKYPGHLTQITKDATRLTFKASDFVHTVNLTDSAPPQFRRWIPTEHKTEVREHRESLLAKLESIAPVDDPKYLTIERNAFGVTLTTANGSVQNGCMITGDALKITLNFNYVLQFVKALPKESYITMKFNGAVDNALFEASDVRYVVSPIRLDTV